MRQRYNRPVAITLSNRQMMDIVRQQLREEINRGSERQMVNEMFGLFKTSDQKIIRGAEAWYKNKKCTYNEQKINNLVALQVQVVSEMYAQIKAPQQQQTGTQNLKGKNGNFKVTQKQQPQVNPAKKAIELYSQVKTPEQFYDVAKYCANQKISDNDPETLAKAQRILSMKLVALNQYVEQKGIKDRCFSVDLSNKNETTGLSGVVIKLMSKEDAEMHNKVLGITGDSKNLSADKVASSLLKKMAKGAGIFALMTLGLFVVVPAVRTASNYATQTYRSSSFQTSSVNNSSDPLLVKGNSDAQNKIIRKLQDAGVKDPEMLKSISEHLCEYGNIMVKFEDENGKIIGQAISEKSYNKLLDAGMIKFSNDGVYTTMEGMGSIGAYYPSRMKAEGKAGKSVLNEIHAGDIARDAGSYALNSVGDASSTMVNLLTGINSNGSNFDLNRFANKNKRIYDVVKLQDYIKAGANWKQIADMMSNTAIHTEKNYTGDQRDLQKVQQKESSELMKALIEVAGMIKSGEMDLKVQAKQEIQNSKNKKVEYSKDQKANNIYEYVFNAWMVCKVQLAQDIIMYKLDSQVSVQLDECQKQLDADRKAFYAEAKQKQGATATANAQTAQQPNAQQATANPAQQQTAQQPVHQNQVNRANAVRRPAQRNNQVNFRRGHIRRKGNIRRA